MPAKKKAVSDIALPGTTPADETSRPIITKRSSIIQDPMMQEEKPAVDEPTAPLVSPQTKKVIAPMVPEPAEIEQPVLLIEEAEKSAETEKPTEPPATTPPVSEPVVQDETPDEDQQVTTTEKPVAKERDPKDVEAEHDKLADKLAVQKKYFVPINVSKHRSEQKHSFIALGLFIVLLACIVAAIDYGLVDIGVQLPFDFL